MSKKKPRDERELAADFQISNMREHFPHIFKFKGGRVSMPVAQLRERLGFAFNHGEISMRVRVEDAMKGRKP